MTDHASSSPRDRAIADLARRIAALPRPHPLRVALDGPDMAGKTTLADELARALARLSATVIRASIDDFHHPRDVRYRRGRTSPEGYYRDAFDLERIRRSLLDPLGPQGNRRYATAVFDWRTDTRFMPAIHLAPDDAILVADGVFLLRPELRDAWDFSIFAWASDEERLSRSKARDVTLEQSAADVEWMFRTRYGPAHQLYWQSVSPRELADVFIDNERPLQPHIAYRGEARPYLPRAPHERHD